MENTRIINNVTAEKLISENKDILIIDVRRFNEYKEKHLKDAINIPVDELEWEIDEISDYKDKPILVYCNVGNKSAIACKQLAEEGFTKLYDLRGGILDYNGKTVSGIDK